MRGSASTTAATPEITATATMLVPMNRPSTYRNPARPPNAAPTPAVESTPGPGVTSRKNTAAANVSIVRPAVPATR